MFKQFFLYSLCFFSIVLFAQEEGVDLNNSLVKPMVNEEGLSVENSVNTSDKSVEDSADVQTKDLESDNTDSQQPLIGSTLLSQASTTVKPSLVVDSIVFEDVDEGNFLTSDWDDSSKYAPTCVEGKNQSPINFKNVYIAKLPEFKFMYQKSNLTVLNNNYTALVTPKQDNYILLDNIKYDLKQFHFHSPSEHQIDGVSYPLEVQFVHQDSDDNYVIVSILFKMGSKTPKFYKKLFYSIPQQKESSNFLTQKININKLISQRGSYQHYNGSLTGPSCHEGVKWLVLDSPILISNDYLTMYKTHFKEDNNRPVQPINARLIVK